MSDAHPEILLVDDGELDELAHQLDDLGLAHRRELGPRPNGTLSPPSGLLVTTARRAATVRRGSPPDVGLGRPIRIIAVHDDSSSTRRLLRRTGFHLVVRLPVHEEVWRLLASDAAYEGRERRVDARIAVGSETSVQTRAGAPDVMLMDVSNRGCRLLSESPLRPGEQIDVRIPDREEDDGALMLPGTVARTAPAEGTGPYPHMSAILFSADLDEAQRMRLGVLINRWSVGPASLADAAPGPRVPACESPEIPGLLLDDETDPAVRITTAVRLPDSGSDSESDSESGSRAERRGADRRSFAVPVVARDADARRVLIGRDLSTLGMRVEPHADVSVGDRLQLALHGAESGEPIIVSAVVHRDDGDGGLALRFDALLRDDEGELEKLVACLPALDSLREGEAFGLGAVVGEVLTRMAERGAGHDDEAD